MDLLVIIDKPWYHHTSWTACRHLGRSISVENHLSLYNAAKEAVYTISRLLRAQLDELSENFGRNFPVKSIVVAEDFINDCQ